MTRAEKQQRHAQKRAKERFNAELTPEYYDKLVQRIQTGKAEFVARQSNRVTLWRMYVHGKEAIVVYDKKRSKVVTLLTPYLYDFKQELLNGTNPTDQTNQTGLLSYTARGAEVY
jgi:hypothetical protein